MPSAAEPPSEDKTTDLDQDVFLKTTTANLAFASILW